MSTEKTKLYDSEAINAAALGAKQDVAKLPELLELIYPFLLFRARSVTITDSLHTAEDLATEILPWVKKRLAAWNVEKGAFMSFLYPYIRSRMSLLAQREGRTMKRPFCFRAKHRPFFIGLDTPIGNSTGEEAFTLADVLTPELPEPDHGTLFEIPLHSLDARERQIIDRHYLHQDSFAEIARGMGTTRQAVHQGLNRALKKIRKAYLDHQAQNLSKALSKAA